MDIIAAYREVGTYRGAAQIAGTTHKTVKRVIARHEAGGAAPERAPRGRNYDGVAVLVAERVEKTSGRISAKRLLPAARAAGYAGSPRNFRRLVAAAKQAWRREHHRGRRPAVWSPGEHLVIDWGVLAGLQLPPIHPQVIRRWSRRQLIRQGQREIRPVNRGVAHKEILTHANPPTHPNARLLVTARIIKTTTQAATPSLAGTLRKHTSSSARARGREELT